MGELMGELPPPRVVLTPGTLGPDHRPSLGVLCWAAPTASPPNPRAEGSQGTLFALPEGRCPNPVTSSRTW